MQKIMNNGKILSIASMNDIFMVCDMVYLTSETNLNNVRYTDAFIDYVVAHKDEYTCIPLVVDINTLLDRNFDDLTHMFKNNRFGTTSIGSFYDFYKVTNGDVIELRATIRIPKRNEEVCGLLAELHSSDEGLKFSYEMNVYKYEVDENNVMIIDAGGADPIGSCVVSIPAVPAAKCQTLVAELIGLEGENMVEILNITEKTEIHVAELSMEQFEAKIRNAFRTVDRQNGYNFYMKDVFAEYFIVFDCETGDYIKFNYKFENDEAVIEGDGEVVHRDYVVKAVAEVKGEKTHEEIIAEKDALISEHENAIAEKDAAIAEKDALIAEKDEAITAKDALIAEKDEAINKANEDLLTVGEQLTNANAEIEALNVIKAEHETFLAEKEAAEKQARKEQLTAKCAKVMSETEIAEVQELIDSLDETAINTVIAEKYVAIAERMKEEEGSPAKFIATDAMVVGNGKSKYITM